MTDDPRFRDELVKAGHLVPMGADGIYGVHGLKYTLSNALNLTDPTGGGAITNNLWSFWTLGGHGQSTVYYASADTATPAWHASHRELPLLFASSAAMAAGGLGMMGTSVAEAGPARRLAIGAVLIDLAAERRMERSMGISAETLRRGKASRLMDASRALTVGGALGTLILGSRNAAAARVSGAALLAGSVCTRFAVFEAGQASARDPRYTVVPQRERLEASAVGDPQSR